MHADDVVIVGGGVAGAATAMFLARDHRLRVAVLERDPTYRIASSSLSASSIRQQFSTPVNIALSRASLGLMKPWLDELGFVEAGYLYLATRDGADALLRSLSPYDFNPLDVNPLRHIDPVGTILVPAGILALTGYYTGTEHRPVKDVGKTSLTGPATVILSGLSVGFESAVYTALLIGGTAGLALLAHSPLAIGIYAILLAWNEYLFALTLTRTEEMRTVR